jgi:hypothetical protein
MAQKEPHVISLPVEIHGREAKFIRREVFPFSGTGKLDVSDAVTSFGPNTWSSARERTNTLQISRLHYLNG